MPKPYSQDLRDRVIDAVERGGMSCRAAARRYEISESAGPAVDRIEDRIGMGASPKVAPRPIIGRIPRLSNEREDQHFAIGAIGRRHRTSASGGLRA
jgi:hypothetical protein